MSNNYRHFLLSPSAAATAPTDSGGAATAKLRQQQQYSFNGLSSSALQTHDRGSSAPVSAFNYASTLDCDRQQVRQFRSAGAANGGQANFDQQETQPQVANYCQLQRNAGASGEHQSPSCASGLGRSRAGTKLPSDGQLARLQQQQQLGRQHYIWQVNNCARLASGRGESATAGAAPLRSRQQQASERDGVAATKRNSSNDNNNSNSNNNNLNFINVAADDGENDYGLQTACHRGSTARAGMSMRQDFVESPAQRSASQLDIKNKFQDETPDLIGQMARLMNKSTSRHMRQTGGDEPVEELNEDDDNGGHNYADQLRRSQFNQFNQQQQHQRVEKNSYGQRLCPVSSSGQCPNPNQLHHLTQQYQPLAEQLQPQHSRVHEAKSSGAACGDTSAITGNNNKGEQPAPQQQQQQQQEQQRSLHVNFNRRSSQANGSDEEDESEKRKKKYLTAKYGQQQMNLIKKRLKVETWLHEQLQTLAEKSTAVDKEAADELDIDLDQLLDIEDDAIRREFLKKTLEPLNDLPTASIDKFIDEVLEQSRLL